MPYMRRPYTNRRFLQQGRPESKTAAATVEKLIGIPLPNETEDAETEADDLKRSSRKPSILDFLKSHIRIEEIILLGLIFLLFEEGIDDELLLILLIYILLG